jgi:hypothetical protein
MVLIIVGLFTLVVLQQLSNTIEFGTDPEPLFRGERTRRVA